MMMLFHPVTGSGLGREVDCFDYYKNSFIIVLKRERESMYNLSLSPFHLHHLWESIKKRQRNVTEVDHPNWRLFPFFPFSFWSVWLKETLSATQRIYWEKHLDWKRSLANFKHLFKSIKHWKNIKFDKKKKNREFLMRCFFSEGIYKQFVGVFGSLHFLCHEKRKKISWQENQGLPEK